MMDNYSRPSKKIAGASDKSLKTKQLNIKIAVLHDVGNSKFVLKKTISLDSGPF